MNPPAHAAGSRYSLMLGYSLVALILFFALRFALLVKTGADTGLPAQATTAALLDALLPVFLRGAVYDLAFLGYFALPFALYLLVLPERVYHHRLHRTLVAFAFFLLLYGLYFTAVAEWLFWDEFGARFNFIAVDYLVYRREVTNNIVESYPLPALLSGVFGAALATWWLLRGVLRRTLTASEGFARRLGHTLPVVALTLAAGVGLDQSLHELSGNRYLNELASNGPYQFAAAFRNNELSYRDFYRLGEDEELSAILKQSVAEPDAGPTNGALYDIRRRVTTPAPEQRRNVILISVESLSASYLQRFGQTDGLTPNLDRLAREGLLFTQLYATGTRTVRGLEAITLSIPPTPGQALVKRPDNQGIFSLGHVFQGHGYDTAYLYGGLGYFDNMNAFFGGNGYRIVDESDLSREERTFSNAWGVADEVIYGRAIREADADHARGQPFFFHIMTTSNHRPYTYPEGRIDLPPGNGRPGAVKYTDYAIGHLIDEARSRPWFANTTFVILADHCASSAGKDDLPLDKYHIPLIVYAPGQIRPREVDTLSSQIDVGPTLLALLGFDYESRFFGRDILAMAPEEGRALVGTYQKIGLYRDDRLAFLAPRRLVTEIEHPLAEALRTDNPEPDGIVKQDMAFYQGADYIIAHRMNRL